MIKPLERKVLLLCNTGHFPFPQWASFSSFGNEGIDQGNPKGNASSIMVPVFWFYFKSLRPICQALAYTGTMSYVSDPLSIIHFLYCIYIKIF